MQAATGRTCRAPPALLGLDVGRQRDEHKGVRGDVHPGAVHEHRGEPAVAASSQPRVAGTPPHLHALLLCIGMCPHAIG